MLTHLATQYKFVQKMCMALEMSLFLAYIMHEIFN